MKNNLQKALKESKMKDSRSFIDAYFEDIIKIPLLSKEEEILYARELRKYDIKKEVLKRKHDAGISIYDYDKKLNVLMVRLERYKHKMIQSNYRLVVNIAKRYRNQYMHLSDLIEEGNLGLMRAVERFDHRKGFRFSTFAIRWIKQNVAKAIIDKGKIVRIPVHIDKMLTKYKKVVSAYQKRYGKSPDQKTIEEALGVPYSKVKAALSLPDKVTSIDANISDSDKELNEFVMDKDERYDPQKETTNRMLQEAFAGILNSLDERERQIIELRYGLNTQGPMTLDVIGKQMNMTRERVRQIQSSALKKMRDNSVCRELKVFLND